MFSVNIRAKSSCDILKSVGISRGIGIFFSPIRFEWRLEVEEDLSAVKTAALSRNTEEVQALCSYFYNAYFYH